MVGETRASARCLAALSGLSGPAWPHSETLPLDSGSRGLSPCPCLPSRDLGHFTLPITMRLPANLCALALSVAFPVSVQAQCEVARFGPGGQAVQNAMLSHGWASVAGTGPVVGVFREQPSGFAEVTTFIVPGLFMFYNVTATN